MEKRNMNTIYHALEKELADYRYKKGESITQFKLYSSLLANHFNHEDLEPSQGVIFGYNEVNAVKGGKVQYSYEYDQAVRESSLNIKDSIINQYLAIDYFRFSLAIMNNYGLGYVVHIPSSMINDNRNVSFWADFARWVLFNSIMKYSTESCARRNFDGTEHVGGLITKTHSLALQLNYLISDAECFEILDNNWDEKVLATIPDYMHKFFTAK
ncbi:hypothetical protein I3271_05400 [Photobacterium leiognathi]|uniref:hypothetical protein n=1 Tax=Photobacterium leiognathi TaxID=553611 RepID=UPI001EDCCB89|nr:hypothetical protein [Photobacterium leiognathi]MCG3884116.1 hypothetical protein [Photobacterium leiognathi]